MSVIIRGVKMPSKCIECKLMRRCGKDDLDYVCMPARVYVEDLTNAYKPRPEYCPLVEIPPNGRLIDADVLMERFSYSPDDTLEDKYWIRAARRIIIEAPTVIEPEEGES